MAKRMARGTVAIRDVNADPSTWDKGKHSRGKWLLAMRALFATRELEPPPMAPPKRPKVTSPVYMLIMRGTCPPIEKPFTFLARRKSRARLTRGVSSAQATPSTACLYWARMSRSARVKMTSPRRNSSRAERSISGLCW